MVTMNLTTELIKTSSIIKKTSHDAFEFFLFAILPLLPVFLAYEILLPSQNLGLVLVLKFLWLYVWSCLILSWSNGFTDNFQRKNIVKPFYPTLKTLKITFILLLLISLLNYLGHVTSSLVNINYFNNLYLWYYMKVSVSISTLMLMLYFIIRSSFAFVAHLEGKELSVEASFSLTKNKEAEIMGSGIIAASPYIAFMFLYNILINFFIDWQYTAKEGELQDIILKILTTPINVFFTPWIVIILFTPIIYYYRDLNHANETPTPPTLDLQEP